MDTPADREHHLATRRLEYESAGIDPATLATDPITQWLRWYNEAVDAGLVEPNAMTVATVDGDGRPDTRIVLARQVDAAGIIFYSNYESAKARQLASNPAVALNFGWTGLHRQVRVRGAAAPVDSEISDAYFAQRPRGSQLSAWASQQSQPIGERADLVRAHAAAQERFGDRQIPRPPHWGGWLVVPAEWEFWQGRPSRLHDRVQYVLAEVGWTRRRLQP